MERTASSPSEKAPSARGTNAGPRKGFVRDHARDRAIYDALRNTSVEQVLSLFNLGQGVKGGPGWMKYEVGNGLHMNVRTDTGGFKVLERTPIPPLTGRDGAAKDCGKGAIDLAIALMYFEGSCPSTPKEAQKVAILRLQEAFHPHTLEKGYKPSSNWKATPKAPPPPPEPPKPCEMPAYDERVRPAMERYLIETRGLPARMVKHLIDERLAYPAMRHFLYTDTRHRLVSMPDTPQNRKRMNELGNEADATRTVFKKLDTKPGSGLIAAGIGAIGTPEQMKAAGEGSLKPEQWALAPGLSGMLKQWQEEDDKVTPKPKAITVTRHQIAGQSQCMVFPLIHVEENFATAYEHKDIPRDFKSKTKGITSGPKTESVFMLGHLNEKTKTLKLTEAPIDAVSKWVLDRAGADTCIVATIGVRLIPALIAKAKRLGVTVEIAYDCDEAGTKVARATAKECEKQGVSFRYTFPKESEAVVEIPNANGAGEKRLEQLLAHCDKLGLPSKPAPKATKDLLRVCVGNTLEMWDLLHTWKDEDNLRMADPRNTAEDRARIKAEPKFDVDVRRNKDWSDVLKGLVEPVAPVLKWNASSPAPAGPAPQTPPHALAAPVATKGQPDVEV